LVWTCDEKRGNHVSRRVTNMNVEGWRGRGRPKKRRIDYVRQDMRAMAIEENGGRRHAAPTPSELGKGQEEEEDLKI
jgi:hypothetical protein